MKILFKNIKELVQIRDASVSIVAGASMSELPTITNAFLSVENGRIVAHGSMEQLESDLGFDEVIDATGRIVMPSWCDSHTHLVYAGNREAEFVDRLKGLSYEDIANRGGGILNSAMQLESTSEESLFQQAKERLDTLIAIGTGAIEIKSGYGLTVDAELKILRVIKRLKETYHIPIKATFLGAHAFPAKYKEDNSEYIRLIIEEMLPAIAKEGLADYIDVFCEKGYFSVEDTSAILKAGKQYGLEPKIHVNQFNAIGGVQIGVAHDALSVDHLEIMRDEDIEILKNTKTMPVALPGCSYFLGIDYTPARKMIKSGLPLAIASDFNPGSSPSGNMNFVVATACIKMKMTPEEAINAATINAAYAMGVEKEVGSITVGKKANLILTKPINSYASIPYSFGSNLIDKVYINGVEIDAYNMGNNMTRTNPYSAPNPDTWQGRKTKTTEDIQYWHQAVNLSPINISENKIEVHEKSDITIVGYACDEGVRRNQGRVGAVKGPDAIRNKLAKLAYHIEGKTVSDIGNINCIQGDLEGCQMMLSNVISELISNGSFPIVLGGGHDIAYGHFWGLYNGLKLDTSKKIGIINFDAHFDLRPIVINANSGTPFNQILEKYGKQVSYLPIGIQRSSNTKELFKIAEENKVQFIEQPECSIDSNTKTNGILTKFIAEVDHVYVTIDLDGFSSAYAPGVSAPSPFGFEPEFVLATLSHIINTNKLITCDIAELNPTYDQDSITANLAARLVNFIASNI